MPPPWLPPTTAGDRQIDGVMERAGIDGADGVGEDAPVEIGVATQDALGHEAGQRRLGADGIGRRADRPGTSLPARIRGEMGVAGGRLEQMVERYAAPAAMADVADDGRRFAGSGRAAG